MNNLTIYDRGSSVRMRMMSWMRLKEYSWHIVFTDCMAVQSPRWAVGRFLMWFGSYNLSFGLDFQDNRHTGPPQSSSI